MPILHCLVMCITSKQRRQLREMGISKAALLLLKERGFYPLRIEGMSWKKRLVCRILNIEKIIS